MKRRLILIIWILAASVLVACNQSLPDPTVSIAAAAPSVSIQSTETLAEGDSLRVIADGRAIAFFAETIPADNVTFRWTLTGSGALKNETSAEVQYIAPDAISTPEEQIVITVIVTDRNGEVAKDGLIIRLVAPALMATETLTSTVPVMDTTTITMSAPISTPLATSSSLLTSTPTPTGTPSATPSPTSTPRVTVLESFEGELQMTWWSPDSDVFSYLPTSERSILGNQSFRIDYNKTDTFQFVAFEVEPDFRNFSWAQTLRVWIYGNVTILLKLEDDSLSQADVAILRATNSNGWTQLSFNIQSVASRIDLSHVRTAFFFIDPGNTTANGTVYFDSIALQE